MNANEFLEKLKAECKRNKECTLCCFYEDDPSDKSFCKIKNLIGKNPSEVRFVWKEEAPKETDNVNHPSHYKTGGFECIDVMLETQGIEAVKSFCICNAFKYLYRHGRKNGAEDIAKAIWYLQKFLELEETKDGSK